LNRERRCIVPDSITEPANPSATREATRTSASERLWRHPHKRAIIVPYRAAAVIAMMEMGVADLSRIAVAAGLSIAAVRRIDRAEDLGVRKLSCCRIPAGQYFRLASDIRCPRCHAMVKLVPCIACRNADALAQSPVPPQAPCDLARRILD
jgi:hypothetical protein